MLIAFFCTLKIVELCDVSFPAVTEIGTFYTSYFKNNLLSKAKNYGLKMSYNMHRCIIYVKC